MASLLLLVIVSEPSMTLELSSSTFSTAMVKILAPMSAEPPTNLDLILPVDLLFVPRSRDSFSLHKFLEKCANRLWIEFSNLSRTN